MSYFKTQKNRIKNAPKISLFWGELLVLIPISMLGIWWPVWFEWSGYISYFMPAAWFTFGVGSLATILFQRGFMGDESDSYRRANFIFIALLCLIGGICYGKALIYELENKSVEGLFCGLTILHLAIFLNVLVWVWHFISSNTFDNNGNPLGEEYEQ